ncbi:hypothetical protein WMY93_004603 [Mugilogobius chulae]|uniref:Arrestin C-terminal-like domain-containing protein n=1 Tax=Mugilogobius chulae TaxID=88201 RepID=A0AAW0PP23_9GOBI
MISTVKSFSVGYNPINEANVFSSGDFITGQVTLEVNKDTEVEALTVKLKGKAEVKWTERQGKRTVSYYSKEKYFTIKQFLIQEAHGKKLVSEGSTVYPFTFQIPAKDLPPSFKSTWGKIVYTLEANLCRSMRMDSTAKAKLNMVLKTYTGSDPTLMVPQHGTTEKKMKLFNSGYVAMDVDIDKSGFQPGEGIKVMVSIHNKSSREVRPKYCVYRKYSFFAKGKRKVATKEVLKEVGDAVPPSAGQTVTRILTVPISTHPSFFNCNIIKAEYRLKVYLDVKYASDPQIKFPVVILPIAQSFDTNIRPTYGFDSFPPTGNDSNSYSPYSGVATALSSSSFL